MSVSPKRGKTQSHRSSKVAVAGVTAAAASLPRRIVAFLIDWYVGALVTSLPVAVVAMSVGIEMTNQDIATYPGSLGVVAGCAGIAAGVLYYVVVPMVTGGFTLGKRLMRVRIIAVRGGRPSAVSLLVRQGVGLLLLENELVGTGTVLRQVVSLVAGPVASTVLLWIGFLGALVCGVLLLVRPDRRGLHDMVAGTKVAAV